ncbi:hypothetical protein N7466_001562 [Penicillium verhagenii]|uniref:uncharacterized protein n=1 Tax=Penicillium verhagenii TaxID=1562060 RepID=UPI002545134C|nr:uncharacterized protein N7466_001562 [Penicillium verhagenii]KAJ5938428.1 hypothetical protein N7466_001562 [Penicillium verhagenii]
MKSSSYFLFVLLPFVTHLGIATPAVEQYSDSLEERNGGNYEYGNHQGYDDHQGYDNKNICEVKQTYPYYKYPCDSSLSNGTSLLGATFTSFCKYQNGNSGVWYAAPRGWVKEEDKPRRCPGSSTACPV